LKHKVNLHNLGYRQIGYIVLLLYFFALTAHQTDSTFDSYFFRITFFLFVGFSILPLIQSKGKYALNGYAIWYICFIVYAFSSYAWAKYNKTDVFQFWIPMIQILGLCIFLPFYIRTEEDIRHIFKIVIISLIYAMLILLIRTPRDAWSTERMGLVIGLNPNTLGVRLAIGAVLLFYFWRNDTKNKSYLLLVGLFAILSLFSGSKKAVIMLVGGIAGFEIMGTKNMKAAKFFRRIFALVIVLFILGYSIFNDEYLYNILGQRLERTFYFLTSGSIIDKSTRERMYYISVAQSLFKEHPFLGIGLNNFKSYIGRIGYLHVTYSHNNYWELLSCLGIFGTMLFYGMHAYIIYSLLKLKKKNKSSLCILFLIIAVLYLICDYGAVSYQNIFQYAIICLIYLYTQKEKRKITYEKQYNN